MAEEGRSLMEIKTYVDETVKQMGKWIYIKDPWRSVLC